MSLKNLNVENMKSSSGGVVPNQFVIRSEDGRYFQSHNSVIVFIPNEKVDGIEFYLGKHWNFSRTTAKYRNQFLRLTTKDIEAKIESGAAVIDESLPYMKQRTRSRSLQDIAKMLIDEIDGTKFSIFHSSVDGTNGKSYTSLYCHGTDPLKTFDFYAFVNEKETEETLKEALEFIAEYKMGIK